MQKFAFPLYKKARVTMSHPGFLHIELSLVGYLGFLLNLEPENKSGIAKSNPSRSKLPQLFF